MLGTISAPAIDPATTNSVPLATWLDHHLNQPRYAAAAWGVKVVSSGTGKTLYARDAGKLLKPASNAKLYTAALALDRLGPDFRIRTSLESQQLPDAEGVLSGDLLVYGRGSPAFAARFNDGSHSDNLAPLARALGAAGVKRVAGDLLADDSYFSGPPLGSGWMWDDLVYYYGAEVSALTVEDNVVDLVFKPGEAVGEPVRILTLPRTDYLTFSNRATTIATGGVSRIRVDRPIGENTVFVHGQIALGASNVYDAVTVHDPAGWFGALVRESLRRQGIAVTGTVRPVHWLDREMTPRRTNDWRELAFVESPPLKELLPKMLKPSQNLYAQLLLLQVGVSARGRAQPTNRIQRTTEDAGLAEMARFLAEVGVPPGQVLIEEGSGLSRGTLLTPDATVQLLTFMSRHRHRDVFRASLPLAGVDGTLRRRMRGTPAAENARAKTGTLRYVNTLSGYVTNRSGDELIYSLMLNNCDCEEDVARRDLDAIVARLANSE